MRHPLLLLLFFLSGAAALIDQVVWMREMSLILGVTAQAVSVVLAVFMGGLALGSWLMGKFADRVASPLRFYAALELGTGVLGALSIALLHLAMTLYIFVERHLHPSSPTRAAIQLGLGALVLLGPTTLMGGTLPALVRATVAAGKEVGRESGRLYAINTLGAMTGVIVAAFGLIEQLGLTASLWVAAALNLVAAVVAAGMARGDDAASSGRPAPATDAGGPPARTLDAVTLAFGVSGFAALGYEVLWTRYLIYVVHENSVYAFSSMLVAFLLGLALGSWLASMIAPRLGELEGPLGAVLTLTAAAAVGTVSAMVWLAGNAGGSTGDFQIDAWFRFMRCLAVLLVPTTLSGTTFTLVAQLRARSPTHLGQELGWLYAVNTCGCILGSLTAGFVALPLLGLRSGIIVFAAIQATVGAILVVRAARRRAWVIVPLSLFAASTASAWRAENPARATLHQGEALDFFADGPESTVAVVRTVRTGDRTLLVDGDGQVSTGPRARLHVALAGHGPALFHPAPHTGLVVGYGAGITAGCLAQEPLDRIDIVELSADVLRAAPFFDPVSHAPLQDPRVHLMRGDARNYLLATDQTYDVITSDPVDPDDAGVTSLYSLEYYQLVRAHLNPHGVAAQWIDPHYDPDAYRMLIRTFQEVFPYTILLWADFTTVVVGMVDPPQVDLDAMRLRFTDPRVRADLATVGIRSAEDFLLTILATPQVVKGFVGTGPLNTDDHPRIEYWGPRGFRGSNHEQVGPLLALRSDDLSGALTHWTAADQAAIGPGETAVRGLLDRNLALLDAVDRLASPDPSTPSAPGDAREAFEESRWEAPAQRYLQQTWDLLASPLPDVVRIGAALEDPELGPAATPERIATYDRELAAGLQAWGSSDWASARAHFLVAAAGEASAFRPRLLAAAALNRTGDPVGALAEMAALDLTHTDQSSELHFLRRCQFHRVLSLMASGGTTALKLGTALRGLTPEGGSGAHPLPSGEAVADVTKWRLWWRDSRGHLEARDGKFVWE